jgi:large subunit ribosomal protein L9
MAVDLILLEDVKNLGSIGDQVRVADGFARNFLLPRKMATRVTEAALRQIEARKMTMQKEHAEHIAIAQAMAEKIAKESVTIAVEATEEGKLYGSVSETNIAEALAEKGIEIERQAVQMDEHIHELGVYTIDIQLHDQVQTSLKVWIVKK